MATKKEAATETANNTDRKSTNNSEITYLEQRLTALGITDEINQVKGILHYPQWRTFTDDGKGNIEINYLSPYRQPYTYMEGNKENKEKEDEVIINRGLESIEVTWNDKIKQKRDVMFDIPLVHYIPCQTALEHLDDDNSFGDTYFIVGRLNETTARIYLEMKKRNRLELSPFEAKKVLRVYCLSLDYVKEIKSLPFIHEHGLFQHKISRVPKYKEIFV